MKALAVCYSPPVTDGRSGSGDTLISSEVLARLATRMCLSVAYFAADDDGDVPTDLRAACRSVVRIPTGSAALAMLQVPVRRVPRTALQRSHAAAVVRLRELAEGVDVVYLHGLPTFRLLSHLRRPAVVNEIDPVSLFWSDLAMASTGRTRRSHIARSRRARRLEREAVRHGGWMVVVNPDDARDLGSALHTPVAAIPNGVRTLPSEFLGTARRPQICFVGALDYPPNVDSAKRLCFDVLPRVRGVAPEARVVLAGRSPVDAVANLAGESVTVLPDVPDVMGVFAESSVAVFPGGFGRGTRNSVLEALRSGTPVVCSAKSARGVARGEHMVVADDPAVIARHVIELLHNEDCAGRARAAAASFGSRLPTWNDAARQYERLLTEAARTPATFGGP